MGWPRSPGAVVLVVSLVVRIKRPAAVRGNRRGREEHRRLSRSDRSSRAPPGAEQIEETYWSLDIEVDGKSPGLSSMLSLGAAAVRERRIVSTFSANLEPLPDAHPHPETMKWWSGFPVEFALATKDPQPPDRAMKDFVAWVDDLKANQLVAVGAPACHDFAFVNYYCHRFVGRNPLGYACLDLLSLAMGRLSAKGYWDLEYRIADVLGLRPDPDRRRHVALEDAILQARTLIELLRRGA